MSEPTPTQAPPPPTLATERSRHRDGRLLVGSGAMNLLLTLVVAGLLVILGHAVTVNAALAEALTQQRNQFNACKDKPASAAGCTQPVAAEPSVIVKEGGRGLPGLPGDTGPRGPQGLQGAQGPRGPVGPVGKAGPPPGCALLASACVGAQGPKGDKGDRGEKGEKGDPGLPGAKGDTGAAGAQGEMGVQGERGVGISSTQCVDDGTLNGSHWLITYSDGAQETSPGPCRDKLP